MCERCAPQEKKDSTTRLLWAKFTIFLFLYFPHIISNDLIKKPSIFSLSVVHRFLTRYDADSFWMKRCLLFIASFYHFFLLLCESRINRRQSRHLNEWQWDMRYEVISHNKEEEKILRQKSERCCRFVIVIVGRVDGGDWDWSMQGVNLKWSDAFMFLWKIYEKWNFRIKLGRFAKKLMKDNDISI